MMQTIFSLSGIIAPAIAAAIIALPVLARQGNIGGIVGSALRGFADGTPLAIGLDVVTFLVAALVPLWLYIPSPQRTDRDASGKLQSSLWGDVRQGIRYIWLRRPLLWLLGTFTVSNFTIGVLVLDALLIKFNLHADWAAHGFIFVTAFALFTSVSSLGGVVGGFAISAWGGLKRRRIYGILIPMFVDGLVLLGFGLSPFLYLTAALGFAHAALVPVMNAHSQTIWQSQVPRELQGRVFSVRRLIAQFTFPISTGVMGWLGGIFNPALIFFVLGGFLALFCIGQLFNPYLLRVEDKAWLEQLVATHTAA